MEALRINQETRISQNLLQTKNLIRLLLRQELQENDQTLSLY